MDASVVSITLLEGQKMSNILMILRIEITRVLKYKLIFIDLL